LAAIYDLDSPWGADRDFYLSIAGRTPIDILDVGCGTGLLCDAYAARGHRAVGVDPTQAMLDVAREKPHGSEIEWIKAGAQEFRVHRLFALAIMTGHAFQVLLYDDDIRTALRNIHHHLRPGGRFIFESRNPAVNWSTRWNYDQTFEVEGMEVLQETRCIEPMRNERIRFEHRYRFPDETLVSVSVLRFLGNDQIVELLDEAGFETISVLGDWRGRAYNPATSDEMIFIARRS